MKELWLKANVWLNSKGDWEQFGISIAYVVIGILLLAIVSTPFPLNSFIVLTLWYSNRYFYEQYLENN